MDALKLSFIGMIIFLGVMQLSVAQESDDTIEFGSVIQGQIEDKAQSWRFEAGAQSLISIYVKGLNGFDPKVILTDANGILIGSNDDMAYPDDLDAGIQALSIPQAGQYIIQVSGSGNSQGQFQLRLLEGYLNDRELDFEDENWIKDPSGSLDPTENGEIKFEIDAVGQREIYHYETEEEALYSSVQFKDLDWVNGYIVGNIFAYQDGQNYDAILVNHQALWSLIRVRDGQESIIRDWTTNSSLEANASSFRLAVLRYGKTVDIFYQGQYVDSVTLKDIAGQAFGFLVESAAAQNSQLSGKIQRVDLSLPKADLVPDYVYPVNRANMVQNYQRLLLIPDGGKMLMTVPEGFAQGGLAGISKFPLAQGNQFAEFIFSTSIKQNTTGEGISGCGISFHDQGSAYMLAYVDNTGSVGLNPFKEDVFETGLFREDMPLSGSGNHTLVVIVREEYLYYVDGWLVGRLEKVFENGGTNQVLVNFDAVTTSCSFLDTWLWGSNP
ncbi:hypothetical protein MASR2M15_09300 [Anaerolineales bacterium]